MDCCQLPCQSVKLETFMCKLWVNYDDIDRLPTRPQQYTSGSNILIESKDLSSTKDCNGKTKKQILRSVLIWLQSYFQISETKIQENVNSNSFK